jgi:hypothetical protein
LTAYRRDYAPPANGPTPTWSQRLLKGVVRVDGVNIRFSALIAP